jgi:hypothetical protein
MGYFLELNLLPDRIHNFSELDGIPVIFSQILFSEVEERIIGVECRPFLKIYRNIVVFSIL